MPTLVDVQWKKEKNKMAKQNLQERFQQLAGIKPLYETGKLNTISDQYNPNTQMLQVHGCNIQNGVYGFMPHTSMYVPNHSDPSTHCNNNYNLPDCWNMGWNNTPQFWQGAVGLNGARWVLDPNNVQQCPSGSLPDCYICDSGSMTTYSQTSDFVWNNGDCMVYNSPIGTVSGHTDQSIGWASCQSGPSTPVQVPGTKTLDSPCIEYKTLPKQEQITFCEKCSINPDDPMCECCPTDRLQEKDRQSSTTSTGAPTPCEDFLSMMSSPPGDIDCCKALQGDFTNAFGNNTSGYDPSQPGEKCDQQWTIDGNSPADGWKKCCEDDTVVTMEQYCCCPGQPCFQTNAQGCEAMGASCTLHPSLSACQQACGDDPHTGGDPEPCDKLMADPMHAGCCNKCRSGNAQGTPCEPHCKCCESPVVGDLREAKNIIKRLLREIKKKQPLNERWNCHPNAFGGSNCGCGSGGCPTISVAGDCSTRPVGNARYNGFDSCSSYCQNGCSAGTNPNIGQRGLVDPSLTFQPSPDMGSGISTTMPKPDLRRAIGEEIKKLMNEQAPGNPNPWDLAACMMDEFDNRSAAMNNFQGSYDAGPFNINFPGAWGNNFENKMFVLGQNVATKVSNNHPNMPWDRLCTVMTNRHNAMNPPTNPNWNLPNNPPPNNALLKHIRKNVVGDMINACC